MRKINIVDSGFKLSTVCFSVCAFKYPVFKNSADCFLL